MTRLLAILFLFTFLDKVIALCMGDLRNWPSDTKLEVVELERSGIYGNSLRQFKGNYYQIFKVVRNVYDTKRFLFSKA